MDGDIPVRFPRRTGHGSRSDHHPKVRHGGPFYPEGSVNAPPEPSSTIDHIREVRRVSGKSQRRKLDGLPGGTQFGEYFAGERAVLFSP